jgi:hypothetical protein
MNIPPTLLDAIRREPDREAHWLALAQHFCDNGNDDFAIVVRHHWQDMQDAVASGMPPEQVLAELPEWAVQVLAQKVREAEKQGLERPGAG